MPIWFIIYLIAGIFINAICVAIYDNRLQVKQVLSCVLFSFMWPAVLLVFLIMDGHLENMMNFTLWERK